MISAQITGWKEIQKALALVPRRRAGSIQRKGLKAAARKVRAVMKTLVPVDTGTLRKSLGDKVKIFRRSGVGVAIIGPRSKFGRAVVAGGRTIFRDPSRYAHLVDQGTRRSRASPFIEPALAAAGQAAMNELEKTTAEELAKVRS